MDLMHQSALGLRVWCCGAVDERLAYLASAEPQREDKWLQEYEDAKQSANDTLALIQV